MNRDIEFRGWDIKRDGWVFGYYEDYMYAFGPHTATIHSKMDWGLNGSFKVIPESVGQYTGMLDMNKKRAYEGDILRWVDWEQELTKTPDVYILAWSNDGCWYLQCWRGGKRIDDTDIQYFIPDNSSPLYDFEIVGNTWENKKTPEGV